MRMNEIITEKDLIGRPSPSFKDIVKKYPKLTASELTKQLNMGIEEEYEHVYSKAEAREIALDHLKEDPKYYTKLSKAMK